MPSLITTIPLEEALRRLHGAARPIARTERLALADASGRVVAEDVTSAIDVPPFARSAMDGYAVIARDVAGASAASPARLRRIDRIFTGQPSQVTISTGLCAEIATGAPLPAGAEAVVMVEDTSTAGDIVSISAPASAGQHVSRRAADIAAGDIVARAGDALTPSRLGAIAAVGRPDVLVYAKPRVAILSTGNEVVDPGQPLAPGHIYDVNRFTLGALVGAHGGVPELHQAAEDTLASLEHALDVCANADLIVFSGGSSVGARDLISDLVGARGTMIFHGIAIRPGKPTAFATIGGALFLGMPGNPTSCLSNAYVLLVPLLRAMARLPPHAPLRVQLPLGRRIASAAGRHQFYTVRIVGGVAQPAFKGSGDITSLSQADGYIEIPATETEVAEGTNVKVTLF